VPDDYRTGTAYKTVKELKVDYPWLSEASATAENYKIQHFRQYQHQQFSGRHLGFPKFKNKHSKQTFSLTNQKIKIVGDKIRLEKIGWVRMVVSQKIPVNARLISCTVSKNRAGQYFVSISVEMQTPKPLSKTGKTVGIDLGLKSFAITSDNIYFNNPRWFHESQVKLTRLQRRQAKKKGSNKDETKSVRWRKLQERINRIHVHISDQRKDFLHKLSTDLIRDYDVIYIEDLNVNGMMQNHKLAKSIGEVSWSMFTDFIEYKSKWYGKEVIKIGGFYPSSKTCSRCGWKDVDQTIDDRVFVCEGCGLEIDRDYNAAINIKTCGEGIVAQRMQMGEVTNLREAFREDQCL
jgi:putative transposase